MMGYGGRYLRAEIFGSYYHKVAESDSQTFFNSQFLKEMEFWEQQGLFFPYIRSVLPEEFVKFVTSLQYGPESKLPFPEDWPDKLKELFGFLRNKDWWDPNKSHSIAEQMGMSITIHPFDEEHGFDEFFTDPSVNQQDWGKLKTEIEVSGHTVKKSRTEPFYCHWQIHFLDAVRRDNAIGIRAKASEIRDNFSNDKVPRPCMEIGKPRYAINSRKLSEFADMYDALSLYVIADIGEANYAFSTGGVEEGSRTTLKGQPLKEYHSRCEDHAKRLFKEFGFTKDRLYDFLKVLCTLYLDYRHDNRQKMADEIKKDISALLDFIEFVTGDKPEAMWEKVGKIGGYFSNALDIIFPDLLEKAKEDAQRTILNHLENYNEILPEEYRVKDSDISELCAYCKENGFSLLLQTIQELNTDWHNINAFTENNLFTHLRNLATLFEDFIKHIGENSKVQSIKNEFDPAKEWTRTLYPSMQKIYGSKKHHKADWWDKFDTRRKPYGHVKPDEVDKKVEEILDENTFDTKVWEQYVARNLILTYVARNFGAHRVRHQDRLFRFYYISLIDSLLQTLVFIWKYSKQNGLI